MTSRRRQRIRNVLAQKPKPPKTPAYTMSRCKKDFREAGFPPMCAQLKDFWRATLKLMNGYYANGRNHALRGYGSWGADHFTSKCATQSKGDECLNVLSRLLYKCYMEGFKSVQDIRCDQEGVAA